MFIIFKVHFPEEDFCSAAGLATLRKFLPAGEAWKSPGADAEDVELVEFDQDREAAPGSGKSNIVLLLLRICTLSTTHHNIWGTLLSFLGASISRYSL
jgi:hypothetical protein